MGSLRVRGFFSCSFKEEDMGVVKYFHSICKGLDIECVNVDRAYAEIPPEKARELITDCDALVAIATKRVERTNGKFDMPNAVSEEISMAFGLEKPILLIVEDGVSIDEGFMTNYCTHMTFKRDELYDTTFLEKTISSINELKMKVVLSREITLQQQVVGEFYSESSQFLISLEKENDEFIWEYSATRKVVFTGPPKRAIIGGVWPCVRVKNVDETKLLESSFDLESASRADLKLEATIDKHTADSIEMRFHVTPTPQAGDWIVYSQNYRSKYLNPIYEEDIKSEMPFVVLNSDEYLCGDGVVAIRSIKIIKIQFRFDKEYGLTENDFAPFIGSFTTRIDYVIESEIKRMKYEVDSFGKNIVINCEVESPLLHHMYGVAWNPPKRKMEKS